jgi:hypothetical protein
MKSSRNLIVLAFLLFLNIVFSQNSKGKIPFYAIPYYNFEPLTITIGNYKTDLLTNDINQLKKVEEKIKADINNTDIESLYILSIRLYDLGQKDDAFYWFQTAKTRARIFINMLDQEKIGSIGSVAFETKQFFISCNQIVGEYLNGYGFNDLDKGIAVFERVKDEVKSIKSFKNIYKSISFINDSNIEIEKSKKEQELSEGVAYFIKNKEEIKKKRIESGIQDKY